MRAGKFVKGVCEKSHKKQFSSYNECLKFARQVERNNTARKKRCGREYQRNVPKTAQKDIGIWKVCKSIYICEYCGYFHFSSCRKKREK